MGGRAPRRQCWQAKTSMAPSTRGLAPLHSTAPTDTSTRCACICHCYSSVMVLGSVTAGLPHSVHCDANSLRSFAYGPLQALAGCEHITSPSADSDLAWQACDAWSLQSFAGLVMLIAACILPDLLTRVIALRCFNLDSGNAGDSTVCEYQGQVQLPSFSKPGGSGNRGQNRRLGRMGGHL